MGIKSLISMSLTDWDGKVSSVIFLGGCNFRCPYCHNWKLAVNPAALPDLDKEAVLQKISESSKWIDGVVLTGGEPTCFEGLFELAEEIKSIGLGVKLDTNGSNPDVIKRMIRREMVDFISMDFKNSFDKYPETTGTSVDVDDIKKSIEHIRHFGSYEFRTTVVPGLVEQSDLEKICNYLRDANTYIIQRYHPENVIYKEFSEISPQSDEEMEELVALCSQHLKTKWRG
ncbi:MAG: anaerobic ribonucleoside-triphosphate reductase activating protein [Candidatus Methanofastidiosa archaeon]|nr:anaerobic ribonucleoside-triphosphate reductase activating protein [Candidatus Methanofastidiosa archaeon]